MPWNPGMGGPQYGWGGIPNSPNTGGQSWAPWRNFGHAQHAGGRDDRRYVGDWQRRGQAPASQRDYGWEYQGGYPHDASIMRTEAGMGDWQGARFAQERSGGLPRGRGRFDVDRWGGPLGTAGPRGRYASDYEMRRRDERIRYGMEYAARRGR
jgi:hypothetical protein